MLKLFLILMDLEKSSQLRQLHEELSAVGSCVLFSDPGNGMPVDPPEFYKFMRIVNRIADLAHTATAIPPEDIERRMVGVRENAKAALLDLAQIRGIGEVAEGWLNGENPIRTTDTGEEDDL